MKKLFLALIFANSLHCASLYTLDNVHSLNLYLAAEVNFLNQDKKVLLKNSVTQKLTKAGFLVGETDADVFVVKIDAKEVAESYVVIIEVGLGEEVTTKREDEIETFAYTYLDSKLIETKEPYTQTLETLNVLIDNFIKAHKDDNE